MAPKRSLKEKRDLEAEITERMIAALERNGFGALRGDKSLVVRAAQQAQKAVDRISGTTFAKNGENGEEATAA